KHTMSELDQGSVETTGLAHAHSSKKVLALNFIYLAIAEGIARGAGLVLFVFMARVLGVTAIGDVAFASSFVLIFTFFADFGLTKLGIRNVARQKDETGSYGSSILLFQVLLALLLVVIAGEITYFMPIRDTLRLITFITALGLIPLALDMSYLF